MPNYDSTRFVPPAAVALVSFRNPETRDSMAKVPMLIDSGADMSFIPRATVVKLNLKLASNEDYELKAFDGSSSRAHAVRADMLFLGRTVKGRYLVRDSDIGILGRDVLNRFAILLDGPGLSWEQWTAPSA